MIRAANHSENVIRQYRLWYGEDPEVLVTAPGRVNLIGEHTDYNEGFVLPVAIDRSIFIAAGRRKDSSVHLRSLDFSEAAVQSLTTLSFDRARLWVNYPIGVIALVHAMGRNLPGMNMCIRGNIPLGAGLSSSAAIEVASAAVCNRFSGMAMTDLDLVALAHRAEHEFVGVHCGIMDQFVAVFGKRDSALFLDCRTLASRHVPLMKNIRILVCDSGVTRDLANSAYNARRAECEEAVKQIAAHNAGVTSLRDVSAEEFALLEKQLTPVTAKRARHVITENARVRDSVCALERADPVEFGRLMYLSHASLRDDYEVSCAELDAIVDVASRLEGIYGARMTGAGFGGCAICMVDADAGDAIARRLIESYAGRTGRTLTVHNVTAGDGMEVTDLSTAHSPSLSKSWES